MKIDIIITINQVTAYNIQPTIYEVQKRLIKNDLS